MAKNDLLDEIDEYKKENSNSGARLRPEMKAMILLIVAASLGLSLYIAVVALLYASGKESGNEIISDRFFVISILSVFLVLGLGFLTAPILYRRKISARCSVPVTVRCVGIRSTLSGDHEHSQRLYAPDWEYEFYGNKYINHENVYTNVNVPKVGSETEAYLNPDDPEELYRPNRFTSVLFLILGIVFTFVGVSGIIITLIIFSKISAGL